MLVIDDNKLKLAKMQETLLKMSTDNRQVNLERYSQTVAEIDKQAFDSLLDELNQVNEHNRTLEDELQFLEQVKGYYDQLSELQMSFKSICEMYGGNKLKLSDLSQIDIEYIENRISTINGYLVNIKNIASNKEKLLQLNEDLVIEEKNNRTLKNRLLEFDRLLVENFINAEGRIVVDGQLQYISIVSEYEKLGYDFNALLNDKETLDVILSEISVERIEVEEKLKTAEICYERNPNSDSKLIVSEISREFLKVKYRLTMLKILQLLVQDCNSYDMFKEKREKILDLIKYRINCLEGLGVSVSIDPFSRTKVREQFDMISSLTDNSRVINRIKKEIAELSERVDEMILQNDEYMLVINNTQDLIISRVGLSDIDVSNVSLDIRDYSDFDGFTDVKVVLDNQVVGVREKPAELNMGIVRQKTNSVIKRVNEMVSAVAEDEEEVLIPELVIVSQPVVNKEPSVPVEETEMEEAEEEIDDMTLSFTSWNTGDEEENSELELSFESESDNKVTEVFNSSIFETVDPFLETPLFTDKVDEMVETLDEPVKSEDIFPSLVLDTGKDASDLDLMFQQDKIDVMPDAFWVTQNDEDTKDEKGNDDVVLTFDEQVMKLLSNGENASEDDTRIKKLVA